MKLVIDPKEISRLGDARWQENLAFRTYLKALEMDESAVDRLVHELTAEVAAQIDCARCRNCCIAAHPRFDPAERRRIAQYLDLSLPELEKEHGLLSPTLDEIFGFGGNDDADPACPFFKNGKCSIEPVQPTDCRTYPHLMKSGFQHRLFGVVENYSTCPIVFNVYEQLKKHFQWEYDEDEDIPF